MATEAPPDSAEREKITYDTQKERRTAGCARNDTNYEITHARRPDPRPLLQGPSRSRG